MAFNPFDAFRKNSKPMMAALTIFVMIVFVLSTGGGGSDFFEWMARQVGGTDQRGAVLGTIEGKDYYTRNLQEILRNRAAANEYMTIAVSRVDLAILRDTDAALRNNSIKDPLARTFLWTALTYRTKSDIIGRIAQLMAPDGNPESVAPILRQVIAQDVPQQDVGRVADSIAQLMRLDPTTVFDQLRSDLTTFTTVNRENEKGPEFRAARRMAKVLSDDIRRMHSEEGMFFSTIPNKTDQDALQFELYLRLADKMEIKFVENDIKKLIENETEGMLVDQLSAEVEQIFHQSSYRNISTDKLRQAIGDEFRVVAARKLYSGGLYSGRESVPFAPTPYEFYEFYKDHCAEVTFEIVDVPVESFLDKVQVPNTKEFEAELDSFFRKYSKQEYDPSREEPGFKEPRKVKLEYGVIDASKPVYLEAIQPLQAATSIASGCTGAFLGAGVVPAVMEATAPWLADPLLAMEDRRLIEKFTQSPQPFSPPSSGFYTPPKPVAYDLLKQVSEPGKGVPMFGILAMQAMAEVAGKLLPARALQTDLRLRDSSVYNVYPILSLSGILGMGSNPWVSPFQAVISSRDMAERIETRDRVAVGVQMLLAPLSPLFEMPVPVASLAPALANVPAPPIQVYLNERAEARMQRRRERIAQLDLEALDEKIKELHKNLEIVEEKKDDDIRKKSPPKFDPVKVELASAKSRDLLDNWIRSHPWADTGKSATLRDKYQLGDDPALKDLFKDLLNESSERSVYERRIAQQFFNPNDSNLESNRFKLFVMSTPNLSEADFSKPVYAAWKADDRPAKEHGRLDQLPADLREQVVKAWKMQKARVLAQKAAEDFAASLSDLSRKELRDANNPPAFDAGLSDKVKAANFTRLNEPIRIAKLKKQLPVHVPARDQLTSYVGPFLNNRQIRFPRQPTRANPEGGMADQLIELRNKPLGETLVVPDRPRDHFYVAVMTSKQELSIPEFYHDVYSRTNTPSEQARTRDSLYIYARMDAFREFRTDLNNRVKAEMKYTETEDMKKAIKKPEEPVE